VVSWGEPWVGGGKERNSCLPSGREVRPWFWGGHLSPKKPGSPTSKEADLGFFGAELGWAEGYACLPDGQSGRNDGQPWHVHLPFMQVA